MDSNKLKKIKEFYDFAGFRLDAAERRLWRGEELISLTPKEFDVLFFLLLRAGRVAEKNELLDAIWTDTFVEETTLARNVSWLRKKLAAESDEKIIETVPKRGYRFLPEVTRPASLENGLAAQEADTTALFIEEGAIFIEEEIVREISVRETITLTAEVASSAKATSPTALLSGAKSGIGYSKFIFPALFVLVFAAISFLVYQNFFRQSAPEIIRVGRAKPFSGLPGREDMPTFSPDGRLVAFVWNKGNDEDLDVYVRMVESGEPVRLTRNEADDIRPTFSPDGKSVAFVRVLPTGSEVFLIPALGGAERRICELRRSFSTISFSPDGKFLAVYDGDDSGQRNGIFLVNTDTGEKKRLTAPPELTIDDRAMFAPDGKSIVFIRNFARLVQEIFVLPLSGDGAPRQITFDKAWIGGAVWSADGTDLIFSSQRKYNGQINLWQISTGAGEPRMIATGGKGFNNLAVSPDKRTFAFVEETLSTNIWRIETARSSERTSSRRFAASNGSSNSPNVSPDGKHVAFSSNRTGNLEIWIADSDGSNARQLTDLKNSQAGSPRFSPDGKWIAFDAQIAGNGDIFVISAEGGQPHRLTDNPAFDFMPAWSGDGNSLYFASERSGSAQLYKISADGGEALQITRNGGRESYEAPDGKQLFYTKTKDGSGLWRVSTDGSGSVEEAVPELAAVGYWRYWTVTTKGIYFVARSVYAPYKINFYDFTSRQTTEIAETDAFPIWVYPGLGAAPDGRAIFYTQSDQNASTITLAEFEN